MFVSVHQMPRELAVEPLGEEEWAGKGARSERLLTSVSANLTRTSYY